ncbi:hypothetical protein [Saccharibacillus alkalitolerans]|uniref:Uncharacterized protein n=1 Tax=Saccharibacillus alkalitolerans TaxID=2705290 RepID=A0ABX0FAP6_9BACL|nr:hypothetical protein [Saccharibacillus alkalitolerans]NGZ78017.1 hypothetical protein [Saccharibacillus alkalitolerans]
MLPGNLNNSEEEAARQKAQHAWKETGRSSIKETVIVGLVLAVVFFLIFYGIAYFRTHG